MDSAATCNDALSVTDTGAGDVRDLIAFAVESLTDAVVLTGVDGRVRYLNPAAEGLLGIGMEHLHGRSLWDVARVEEGVTGRRIADPLTHYAQRETISLTPDHLIVDGAASRPIQISAFSIRGEEKESIGAAFVMRDAAHLPDTPSRTVADETGLPCTHPVDRCEFERRLADAMTNLRPGGEHTLLFLQLDGLPVVKEAFGDDAVRQAFQQITALCWSAVRARDSVTQWSCDELAVLLERCPASRGLQTARLLRTLLQNFRFVWQSRMFEFGTSLGFAATADTGGEQLLPWAQRACENAKEKQGNQIICATPRPCH